MKNQVIVLSKNFEPLGKVPLERAICLLYLQKCYALKNSSQFISSVSERILIPEVIVLYSGTYYRVRNVPFSRKNVFIRDGHKCLHCGDTEKRNLSLDHVIPRSRWNDFKDKVAFELDSYENTVTLCRSCNTKKSSKLFSELGWDIPKPKRPLGKLDLEWEKILPELFDSN